MKVVSEVGPVSAYLRDLMLGDVSPLTCRSYGFGLLRWHRLLWFLQISWDRTTEAEVAALTATLDVPGTYHVLAAVGAGPAPATYDLALAALTRAGIEPALRRAIEVY